MTEVKVDDKIKTMFKELTDTEYQILKDGIKEDGNIKNDPISVWKETGIIYDGYHRYKACEELGIKPTYKFKSHPSRNHVLLEIYHIQLGRRNVTPEVYAIYLLEMQAIQKKVGGDSVILPTSKIAEESHLSESSVTKLKRIKKVNPRAIKRIKNDESTIQKEYELIGGRPANPKKEDPKPEPKPEPAPLPPIADDEEPCPYCKGTGKRDREAEKNWNTTEARYIHPQEVVSPTKPLESYSSADTGSGEQ